MWKTRANIREIKLMIHNERNNLIVQTLAKSGWEPYKQYSFYRIWPALMAF